MNEIKINFLADRIRSLIYKDKSVEMYEELVDELYFARDNHHISDKQLDMLLSLLNNEYYKERVV